MPTHLVVLFVLALAAVRLGLDPLALDVVAALAALLAAASFTAGDPPRLPWGLRALGIVLVLVAHVIQRVGWTEGLRVDFLLLIAANLLGVLALLGFLHNVRRSGLAESLTRSGLALVVVGFVAVLVLVASQLGGREVVGLRDVTLAVSMFADASVFLLALLLLRLVLPMRGGMVAQPYLLLVVDGLLYLVVDIALATELPALVGASGVLAALAGAAGASAGFAQRALVRRPAAADRG